MVYHYQCLCYNVDIHLSDVPKEVILSSVDDKSSLRWIKQTNWQKLFKGALSLGNIKMKQDKLVIHRKIQDGWTIFSCINCGTDLYALDSKSKKSNEVFLNDVPQKPVGERLKDMKDHFYSKVYDIILQEDPKAAKHLLEGPDEKDEEPFRIFKSLQAQLEQAIHAENLAMEKRIEAFRQEQQNLLGQFSAQAYHERKLLWHKVSGNLNLASVQGAEGEVEPPLELTQSMIVNNHKAELQQAANNVGIVIIEDYEVSTQPQLPLPLIEEFPVEVNTFKEDEARKAEEQAKSFSDIKLLPTTEHSDAAMFDFDEDVDKTEQPLPPLPEEPEEELETDTYKRSRAAFKVSTDIFGTSVPISIQRKSIASTYAGKGASQRDREQILSEQLVGSTSSDEISKSFDVPMSLNSRRTAASYL